MVNNYELLATDNWQLSSVVCQPAPVNASNPSFLLFSEELRVSTIHAIGRLSQQPTGQSEICNVKCEISPAAPADLFMQNKPNLCVFWAVSGDCEEKQTQFKPNQTQFKPNFQTFYWKPHTKKIMFCRIDSMVMNF